MDLSISNPKLARLAAIKAVPGTKTAEIKLSQMPSSMQQELVDFYTTLSGEPNEDFTVLLVSFDTEGMFKRSYQPCVYKDEDGKVFISWSGKKFYPNPANFESLEVDSVKFGQYSDPALTLELADERGVMSFPLRTKDKDTDVRLIRKAFTKGGLDSIGEFLSTPGSGNSDLPMTDVRNLTPGVSYDLVSARKIKVSYGDTYILTIKANPEGGLEVDHQAWSHKNLNALLDAGAILPATLTYQKQEYAEGKFKHIFALDCEWEQGEDELNLSW